MGVIITPETPELRDYIDTFIQRLPRYGVKGKKGWYSLNKPLTDKAIKAHLDKKRIIGVLAKWYPEFAIIDIDDRPIEFVDELRAELGLDKANSMLMSSESPNSYHLLFRQVRKPVSKLDLLYFAGRILILGQTNSLNPQSGGHRLIK